LKTTHMQTVVAPVHFHRARRDVSVKANVAALGKLSYLWMPSVLPLYNTSAVLVVLHSGELCPGALLLGLIRVGFQRQGDTRRNSTRVCYPTLQLLYQASVSVPRGDVMLGTYASVAKLYA
jgi:hypothetical protein